MRILKCTLCLILLTFIVSSGCHPQDDNQGLVIPTTSDRKPAVAGMFYPADKAELTNLLKTLFKEARPNMSHNLVALVAPHAGYIFSGQVAASSFNQIDTSKIYKRVFIIGSSHYDYFEGASVYSPGNYITPLGEVKVDRKIVQQLSQNSKYFSYVPSAHRKEHCVEVELPFLQYKLGNNFTIVPIVIGTQSPGVCKEVANALLPYFNENNLFVISSDFSHYPSYINAVNLDHATALAILSGSPEKFLKIVKTDSDDHVPGLVTRACGWTSLLTLEYLTGGDDQYEYRLVDYKNSGDSDSGDKLRVVGYNSIIVERKDADPDSEVGGFTYPDKRQLLGIARNTIEEYLDTHKPPLIDTVGYDKALLQHCGVFVTLKNKGELRGCIGQFVADKPLCFLVRDLAVAAATQDYRFSPVTANEMKDVEIEISVLTPLKKIDSIGQIKLGCDGIYIKKGNKTGTFLPQVATETGWKLEEYLGHCARDKAGIGWEGWKDAEIFTYQAIVFSDNEINKK